MGRRRYVRFGACVVAALGLWLIVNAIVSAWRDVADIDFHVFYTSAMAWRNDQDLYQAMPGVLPNLNPPQFIAAFTPLTWVDERTAVGLWSALNIVSLLAAASIIWRELRISLSLTSLMVGIAAAGLNIGLVFGLEEGHPVGIFTLCLTAAWASDRRGSRKTAALLLGLLCSVKPFFGCLLLIPLCRRQWKLIALSLSAAGAALLAGVGLAGTASFSRWIETGRQVSWFHHPLNASIAGITARAGADWQLWLLLTLAVLLITTLVVHRSNDLDAKWLICGIVSLLASPLGWVYYLPLLAGPFAAIALRCPATVLSTIGFLWPVPFVMTLVPKVYWAQVTVISLTTWSLFAVWFAAIVIQTEDEDLMWRGFAGIGRQGRSEP